jgi:outer membrane protein assembly factor BamA
MKTSSRFLRTGVWLVLLCVLVTVRVSTAQTSARQAPALAHKLIAVNATGSQRFTSEEIAAATALPIGAVLGDDDFHKAARQLGESGAFSDVSYTYAYSSAGIKLTFQVTDSTEFVPAHFEDFVWFTDDELRKKIHERVPLFNGDLPANGHLPDEVSDVLQAIIVENAIAGHVDYVRSNGPGGKLESFDYGVAGVTIRIHSVEISGAGAAELPMLQAATEKLADREYSRETLNSFVAHALLPIYHERGYLKATFAAPVPKVVSATASDTGSNNHNETLVAVALSATPGAQYKLSHVDWSGNKEFTTEMLQPLLHAKAGQPANSVQLTDDLKQIQELYGSHGYVTTSIKVTAQFDDAATAVAYNLDINEGYVYHMGDLEFRGLDNSLTARLRAIWKLRPGDVYDASYLKEYLPQARKLLPVNLDWDVSSHVTANTRDKTVDVDLQYTAKAPQ